MTFPSGSSSVSSSVSQTTPMRYKDLNPYHFHHILDLFVLPKIISAPVSHRHHFVSPCVHGTLLKPFSKKTATPTACKHLPRTGTKPPAQRRSLTCVLYSQTNRAPTQPEETTRKLRLHAGPHTKGISGMETSARGRPHRVASGHNYGFTNYQL